MSNRLAINPPPPDRWEGPFFADAVKNMHPFTNPDFNNPEEIQYVNGWPVALGPNQSVMTAGFVGVPTPVGTYQLTWEGEGSFEFFGAATKSENDNVGEVSPSAPGESRRKLKRRTSMPFVILDRKPLPVAVQSMNLSERAPGGSGELTVKEEDSHLDLFLRITSTNPANPLRNIRALIPLHDESDIFFRPFIKGLIGVSGIRLMNWMRADQTYPQEGGSWGEGRPSVKDQSWMQERGVPLEVCIQLCNAVDAEPWLNVRHQTEESSYAPMAQLFKNLLNPHLKVRVASGNEGWNGIFEYFWWLMDQAGGNFQVAQHGHALITAKIASAFSDVLGFERVIGVLEGHSWNAAETLMFPHRFLSIQHPDFAPHIKEFADAPYYWSHQPIDDLVLNPARREELFNRATDWRSVIDRWDEPNWDGESNSWAPSVNQYVEDTGMGRSIYECSSHLLAERNWSSQVNVEAVLAIHDIHLDPKMEEIELNYFIDLLEITDGMVAAFNGPYSPWSKWGDWGTVPQWTELDDGNPQWVAWRRLLGDDEPDEERITGSRPAPIILASATFFDTNKGNTHLNLIAQRGSISGGLNLTEAIPIGKLNGIVYSYGDGQAVSLVIEHYNKFGVNP